MEFVVPFSSRSQVVMNKSSNDTFFCSKRGIGFKEYHLCECFPSNVGRIPSWSRLWRWRRGDLVSSSWTDEVQGFHPLLSLYSWFLDWGNPIGSLCTHDSFSFTLYIISNWAIASRYIRKCNELKIYFRFRAFNLSLFLYNWFFALWESNRVTLYP